MACGVGCTDSCTAGGRGVPSTLLKSLAFFVTRFQKLRVLTTAFPTTVMLVTGAVLLVAVVAAILLSRRSGEGSQIAIGEALLLRGFSEPCGPASSRD